MKWNENSRNEVALQKVAPSGNLAAYGKVYLFGLCSLVVALRRFPGLLLLPILSTTRCDAFFPQPLGM
jgi:hypothetical protein